MRKTKNSALISLTYGETGVKWVKLSLSRNDSDGSEGQGQKRNRQLLLTAQFRPDT